MAENLIEPEAGTAAAAPRRPAGRRIPKLDAVLAAAVDSARAGVLTIAPAEQVGAHVSASAEGERLVLHRFEAKLAGYRGWHWYATVARVPRGKAATVCEVGLLPSEDSLLAPEWVPWADRIRPEDVPEPEAGPETEAAAAEAGAGQQSADAPAGAGGDGSGTDTGAAGLRDESAEDTGDTGEASS
ncbi:DUF3027 domain-containing protein [Arthrobacter sp. GCM10027362]|uniref:DUF3027 domain-containing protein n=1 Tax=Arthrobacter sp. GCM10027362 TaxID=3273379 RepID=UPI0036336C29